MWQYSRNYCKQEHWCSSRFDKSINLWKCNFFINLQMSILSLRNDSSCEWLTLLNHYWNLQILVFSFLLLFLLRWHRLINIYLSNLLKWRWCIKNGWDSLAGKVEDWKFLRHKLVYGSWHRINLYKYVFPIFSKIKSEYGK